MPAFAQKAGGMLTDAQIEILVRGIRTPGRSPMLSERQSSGLCIVSPGDAARGQDVFADVLFFLSRSDGRGARAIADPSYLALVSDQHLRTVTITGMPHSGVPDWRGNVPASRCPMPMSPMSSPGSSVTADALSAQIESTEEVLNECTRRAFQTSDVSENRDAVQRRRGRAPWCTDRALSPLSRHPRTKTGL